MYAKYTHEEANVGGFAAAFFVFVLHLRQGLKYRYT